MNNHPRTRSISNKLTISLIAALSIVSVIAAFSIYVIVSHASEKEIETKADSYLAFLQDALAIPLWNIDANTIRHIGEAFSKNDVIVSLSIADQSGKKLFVMDARDSDATIIRQGAINFGNQHLGDVYLKLTRNLDKKKDRRILFSTLFITILIITSLSALTGIFLRGFLHRPIQELSIIAEQFATGNYDTQTIRPAYKEFSLFISVLENMGKTIDHQMGRLKQIGRELENRVETRATELRQANSQLKIEIHHRKITEKALRESERKLSTLLASLPGMAYRCKNDINWTMEFVSNGCEKVTGYRADQLVENRHIAYGAIIHPDDADRVWETIQDALRQRCPFQMEYRIVDPKNNEKWVWEQGSGVFSDAGDLLALEGFISDISDRKQAEAEQEKLQAQLRQSHKMEAVGTLAGGIAHDVNNILGIIIGNAELAMLDLPDQDPVQLYMQEILEAGHRAKDIVRQLLSFSRKSEEDRKPINLIPIVKESLKLMRASTPANIEIRQNIPDHCHTISGDLTQIHQIMINICTNASHAMQAGGGTLDIRIEDIVLKNWKSTGDFTLPPGKYVKLSISDTGHGMLPEMLEHIFNPYFTTKEVGKGSGMGLAVVHGIVKNHQGAIAVTSKPNIGTTFDIFFPAVEASAEQEIKIEVDLPRGNERILLIDDEEALVNAGRQRLQKLGYTVESRTDPYDALDLFQKSPDNFDIIISDLTMPRISGDELIRKILKIRPDVKAIICTGYNETLNEEKVSQIGIDALLIKPVNSHQLAVTVRNILNKTK